MTEPIFHLADLAPTPTAQPRRRRWLLVLVLTAAAVLLVVASVLLTLRLSRDPAGTTATATDTSPASRPAAAGKPTGNFAVRGSLALPDGGFTWGDSSESSCTGYGGFDDITTGTQVVVMDATGRTLAVGALTTTRITKGADGRLTGCTFNFLVQDVPYGHPFYRLAIGRRGHLEYNSSQIQDYLSLVLN